MLERVFNFRGLGEAYKSLALDSGVKKQAAKSLSPQLLKTIHAPVLSSVQDIHSIKGKILKLAGEFYGETDESKNEFEDSFKGFVAELEKLDLGTIKLLIPELERDDSSTSTEIGILLEKIVEDKAVGDGDMIAKIFSWVLKEASAFDDMKTLYQHIRSQLNINVFELTPIVAHILTADTNLQPAYIKQLAERITPLKKVPLIKEAQARHRAIKDPKETEIEADQYNSTFLLYSQSFAEAFVILASGGFQMEDIQQAMKTNREIAPGDLLALSILFLIIHRLAENPNQDTEKLVEKAFNDIGTKMELRNVQDIEGNDNKVDEFLEVMRELLYPYYKSQ